MNDDPDTVLLRRYLDDGDETAFAELVRRYLGLVYHAALRQTGGQASAAEDIAQTVFTLLARKAASLVRHETLAGWLHTTTRYTAHFHRRRESRRIRREGEAHLMQEDHATETGPSDWERLRPLIDEVLAELTAADRDAILLRFFTGLPFAEVGAKLKVSENTARMRVERALEKLHVRLTRRGVASTASALSGVLMAQAAASAPAGFAASVTSAALSGAAVGGAGAFAVAVGLFSMNAKTVILTAALLLAMGSALFQFNQARERETLLIEANRDRDALRERLRTTTTLSERASPTVADASASASERESNGDLPTVVATPSDRPPEPPRMAKIRATATRRIQSLDAEYRPLYRVLGLDAARSEKFKPKIRS